MREPRDESRLREAVHRLLVVAGGAALTFAVFAVLPLMETIGRPPDADLLVQDIDTAALPPPPPPPPEPEREPEDEPEDPPELTEQAQPLDLSQLELALDPGSFGDGLVGDFAVKLGTAGGTMAATEELFSLADLDQKPRALHQPSPTLDAAARRRAPGTVTILFLVDQDGRVESPMVQSSTDPVFEKPALAAVRQWKFEPGKRGGKPVRFRMKVPITFPAGR